MKRKTHEIDIGFSPYLGNLKRIVCFAKIQLCLLLLILSHFVNANVVAELKPFKAEFVAYRSGNDVGSALLSLSNIDKNKYELVYHSKLSRFFLSDKRYEKTIFTNVNENYIPLTYEYKRSGTGPNKSLSLEFDQDAKQIKVNDETELEWSGEFDNQLFRIDLPKKLAQGISEISYDFINYRGEKRHYEITVLGEEYLRVPYGQLEALKVEIARESNSRVTYAWFAPSLGHNLVRLQQFKDEKEQGDIKLSTFTYL